MVASPTKITPFDLTFTDIATQPLLLTSTPQYEGCAEEQMCSSILHVNPDISDDEAVHDIEILPGTPPQPFRRPVLSPEV